MEGLGKWKAENSVYKRQTRKRRMSMCGEEPAPREHGKGRSVGSRLEERVGQIQDVLIGG